MRNKSVKEELSKYCSNCIWNHAITNAYVFALADDIFDSFTNSAAEETMIEAPEDVYSELALPLELIDTGILRNYSLVKPILKAIMNSSSLKKITFIHQ